MKRHKVLMVAFDYPPSKSVGSQRPLRMSQYLPEFGWEPYVLTGSEKAYPSLEFSQKIPKHMTGRVFRKGALDVDRHLSVKGKHFGWMKVIDRWSTWMPGAILEGAKIIRQHRPDVIWSTYPILSAHIVATYLSKKYDIPLVVDYRDPLGYIKQMPKGLKRLVHLGADKSILSNCAKAVFATDEAKEAYQTYYRELDRSKFHTIENGYYEGNFEALKTATINTELPFSAEKFSLYYSGVLYANGRDPRPLFLALSRLKASGKIDAGNFELVFQGAGDGSRQAQALEELDITDLVVFREPVPFLDSLRNMQQADVLVLIQDEIFNLQVPGKLFEYIRAHVPVLVAAPLNSATAKVAQGAQCGEAAHSALDIERVLRRWLEEPLKLSKTTDISRYSRKEKAKELAALLDEVMKSRA